jgi:hypothetical protein
VKAWLGRRLRAAALAVGFVSVPAVCAGQSAPPSATRVFLPNLADEDWSFLADPARRIDAFDPVKYIPFREGRSFLTLGGEARFRPEGFRVHGGDDGENIRDNYIFQRYLLAADWHIGRRFRAFGELQSGLINGKLAAPRPTDKDVFDVHQAFFEYRSPRGQPRQFRATVGRQELAIGSSRLISASQGLNVKRSFDGVSAGYRGGLWAAEGGAARLVGIAEGVFDDAPDSEQDFWGAAVARRAVVIPTASLGAYYLGIDRERSAYVQGIAAEVRHTVGAKFSGTWKLWDFNYDVIGQWGTFANAPIRSWAVAAENGIRFRDWPMRPRFSLRLNAAAGDRDPADPHLQSFNPLFPGNSYSGLVGLFGPTNLSDVGPAVQLLPSDRLAIIVESPAYFRTSVRDGVYSIALRPLISGQANRLRFVGTNPGVVAAFTVTPHLNVQGVVSRFLAGDFLAGTFVARGFGFYSSSITFRF